MDTARTTTLARSGRAAPMATRIAGQASRVPLAAMTATATGAPAARVFMVPRCKMGPQRAKVSAMHDILAVPLPRVTLRPELPPLGALRFGTACSGCPVCRLQKRLVATKTFPVLTDTWPHKVSQDAQPAAPCYASPRLTNPPSPMPCHAQLCPARRLRVALRRPPPPRPCPAARCATPPCAVSCRAPQHAKRTLNSNTPCCEVPQRATPRDVFGPVAHCHTITIVGLCMALCFAGGVGRTGVYGSACDQ